jgi:Rieske Fe-S protein
MKNVTRRNVLKIATTASAGVCLCGGTGGCATFTKKGATPPIAKEAYTIKGKTLLVQLDKVPQLSAAGGAVKIIDLQLPTPIILARSDDNTYCAVSLLCPHRGAEVEYRHEEKQFRCASLGHSTFKLDGTKIKGFAKQGLQKFTTERDPTDKNCLTITFV